MLPHALIFMTFIIIEPTADDSESISEVLRTTWLATYPSAETGISKRDIEGIDFQSPAAVAKRKKSITNTDANKHLWVAREDEKVVGICRVSKIRHADGYKHYVPHSSIKRY